MAEYVTPYLPEDALAAARTWRAQGKIVRVLAFEKNPLPRCGNCQDDGLVYLTFLGAGPKSAPIDGKRPGTWLEADGEKGIGAGWYVIDRTVGYACPHCQGLRALARRPKPKPAAVAEVARVAEDKRIRMDLD